MSFELIAITAAIVVSIAVVAILLWRATSAEFWLDMAIAAGDRIWDKVGPKIIAKLTARMPPDEEKAWNAFRRTNPDKREEQKWWRDYQKRKAKRESALKP